MYLHDIESNEYQGKTKEVKYTKTNMYIQKIKHAFRRIFTSNRGMILMPIQNEDVQCGHHSP